MAAPLAEVLQLCERQVVAAEVQQAVKQHAAMPARQHKAVAVKPAGVSRIMSKELCPEHGGKIGCPHRQTGMARVGALHAIHAQAAYYIGCFL